MMTTTRLEKYGATNGFDAGDFDGRPTLVDPIEVTGAKRERVVPPNVVPFARPRAIAEIVATHPHALAVRPVQTAGDHDVTSPISLISPAEAEQIADQLATNPVVKVDADELQSTTPVVRLEPEHEAASPKRNRHYTPMAVARVEAAKAPVQRRKRQHTPMPQVTAELRQSTSVLERQLAIAAASPFVAAPVLDHRPINTAVPTGATTLVGIGARAVRAVALAGTVEARDERVPSVVVDEPALHPMLAPAPAPAIDDDDAPTNVPTNDNVADDKPWQDFERMGLGRKPKASGTPAKLVVSAYRLLGFAVLTMIVVVLVGYVATTVFYFVNDSWALPVRVSANDEKVIALQAALADAQNQRDRLIAERADTDRAIVAHQEFQSEFAKAIETDLEGRKSALERVRRLGAVARKTRKEIRQSNDAYAADHAEKISQEYDARLIDRSAMLTGKHQLAQIETTHLSLAEREAALAQQRSQLEVETRALDALLQDDGGKSSTAGLSYDVLKIKRDYDESMLELQKAGANRKLLDTAIARQDEIIAGIERSSYLRALADKATVALVPYDHLAGVKQGTKVFACRLEMLWCREVGSVIEVLPGELSFKHRNREKTVRGQMVELRITENNASSDDVLFLGDKPLWL